MTAPRNPAPALNLGTVGLSLIVGGLGVWTMVAGPTELLPIHYTAAGQADDWGSRELVGGTLVGLALLTLLLGGGMALAAGRTDDPWRSRALRYAQLVIVVTIPLISLLVASASLSGTTDIGGALSLALMSLVILLIGAFLGRVPPNPFVGVRTPWAYKSRLAWDRSNRLAGAGCSSSSASGACSPRPSPPALSAFTPSSSPSCSPPSGP
ncbi:MAG: SdpI family protein [Brevundimonas sp.]